MLIASSTIVQWRCCFAARTVGPVPQPESGQRRFGSMKPPSFFDDLPVIGKLPPSEAANNMET